MTCNPCATVSHSSFNRNYVIFDVLKVYICNISGKVILRMILELGMVVQAFNLSTGRLTS